EAEGPHMRAEDRRNIGERELRVLLLVDHAELDEGIEILSLSPVRDQGRAGVGLEPGRQGLDLRRVGGRRGSIGEDVDAPATIGPGLMAEVDEVRIAAALDPRGFEPFADWEP